MMAYPKKRKWACLLLCVLCAGLFGAGCSGPARKKDAVPIYVFVTKSAGNPYNDCMARGFEQVIREAGGSCRIVNPVEATAEAQLFGINETLQQGNVVSLTVAANDADALQDSLQAAMQQGIKVISVDSATNADSRMTFVNQAATEDVARALVEEVWTLCGGAGQWAILSATSQAANQNAWIEAMQRVLEEDEKYKDLRLVDIVYGNDVAEDSRSATRRLLSNYPQLEVICAPTAVGLPAAAETVRECGSSVRVTGLGLPSEMASYISNDPDAVCPSAYLWDPEALGELAAYVSLALVDGTIRGQAGDSFTAGAMGTYTLQNAADGGTEVILNLPLRIDGGNINRLRQLF